MLTDQDLNFAEIKLQLLSGEYIKWEEIQPYTVEGIQN